MMKELRVQYRGVCGDWILFANYPRRELRFAALLVSTHNREGCLRTEWRLLRARKVILANTTIRRRAARRAEASPA